MVLYFLVFVYGIWLNIIYIKYIVLVSIIFSIGLFDYRIFVWIFLKCYLVSYLFVFLNYKLIIIINMFLVKKKVFVFVKKFCFKKEILV